MSISRIFSEVVNLARRVRPSVRVGAVALTLLVCWPGAAAAQEVLTQDEALALAFPNATSIDRRTAFLTDAQLAAVRGAAGRDVDVSQQVITYYVGLAGDRILGYAYFDAHRVRTMPEVLMVTVTPDATVGRIEILSFSEPPEYRAPAGWLRQFPTRRLTPDLSVRRAIPNITGATLTSRAVTSAVRRILAVHQVIHPRQASAVTGTR
jgi:Na+-translocating ferredoxin:NAD+ oxidoreductase subunit G